MKNQTEKIKGTVKENIDLMMTPLMAILPGQISFFVILSIIPLASLLFIVISKLSLNYDFITNFITYYLPSGIANIVLGIFTQQKVGAMDVIFIVMALYLSAKATHSIIVASTQIYDGKQRDFFRTRIKAMVILIILILLVVGLIAILTFGGRFLAYLSEVNGDIYYYVNLLYKLLKWPFVFFMMFFVIKVIYTIAPNVNIPSRSVNKGALFTSVVWVLSTYVFSFYVTRLANFSKFYGNLSSLIILMIWIYWLCYIFVYGMTLNEYKFNPKQQKDYNIELKEGD